MTFVLIPGAGCTPYHWHPLTNEFRRRGHAVIEVDLPCDDPAAGLTEYANAVVAAVAQAGALPSSVDAVGSFASSGGHSESARSAHPKAGADLDHSAARAGDEDGRGSGRGSGRGRGGRGSRGLTVVAHSLGGMTAPLVCERLPVELLVLVAGMIPQPGESIEQWWDNTGYSATEDDVDTFFDDLPAELAEAARRELRDQANGPMAEPWPLQAWPDVPTRAVIARDDLLFPPAFLRRVTEHRLGFTPDETPGGHFPMLGHPTELADRLESYRAEISPSRLP